VGGAGEGRHQQLQAVGVTVAGDFPLLQLELVEAGFDLVAGDAVLRHLAQHIEHQLLKIAHLICLTALDTTDKAQFFLGIVKAAEGRGGCAEFGGFQGHLQR